MLKRTKHRRVSGAEMEKHSRLLLPLLRWRKWNQNEIPKYSPAASFFSFYTEKIYINWNTVDCWLDVYFSFSPPHIIITWSFRFFDKQKKNNKKKLSPPNQIQKAQLSFFHYARKLQLTSINSSSSSPFPPTVSYVVAHIVLAAACLLAGGGKTEKKKVNFTSYCREGAK